MEVSPGYKQTEVGVIPIEWEVKRLGNLGTVVRGGSPRPAGDPRYFNGSFIHWLTVASLTNIPEGQLHITDTATKLTEEGSRHSRMLESGLLVMVNSGARTLGVTKILAIACCANDGIAALLGQREGDKRYLCYFLNSQTTRLREVIAAGNDQLNLNTGRIALLPIPYPDEDEQCAIADALSDVDELLAGLDRLIAKKRDIKQAAMQQLLTGKTRLPGFNGKWEVVEFGDVATIRNTKVQSSAMTTGTPCVELDSISQGGGRLLTISEASGSSIKYTFKSGDVLFGRLRAYLRKYWLATFDGICSTEIWPLMPVGARIVPGFLHLIVQTDAFLAAAGVSYGTHMPRSDWGVLRKFSIRLPKTEEQQEIAEALADMDAELAALESRRDKTRALKQGMMQELLTGRTRLV